jgi:hypothetical protein
MKEGVLSHVAMYSMSLSFSLMSSADGCHGSRYWEPCFCAAKLSPHNIRLTLKCALCRSAFDKRSSLRVRTSWSMFLTQRAIGLARMSVIHALRPNKTTCRRLCLQFPKIATCLQPLLSTHVHATVWVFFTQFAKCTVQIGNKMGLQRNVCRNLWFDTQVLYFRWLVSKSFTGGWNNRM